MRIALPAPLLRLLLLLVPIALLGACTQYDYLPPPTPEGQSCVAQCRMMRAQCVSQHDLQLQQCNMMRSTAMNSYNRCRAAGGRNCVEPPFCTGGSYQCTAPFDECFRACGGRIVQAK